MRPITWALPKIRSDIGEVISREPSIVTPRSDSGAIRIRFIRPEYLMGTLVRIDEQLE
jgi:hypothetical protein